MKHPEVRAKPYTTSEVAEDLIKSAVKAKGCRYVDLIKDDSGTALSRGKDFYFISHGWHSPFVELVDQVIEHFKPENQAIWQPQGSKILQWDEVYIWLDILVVRAARSIAPLPLAQPPRTCCA